MKRNFILLLTIILSCVSLCFGQGKDAKVKVIDTAYNQGSNIVFPELTDQMSENLDLLGRVWGFLKYHHPAIAQGKYNWDYELFRMLPGYLQVPNQKERDAYLVKWIQHYGRISVNKEVVLVDSNAVLKPDLRWINPEQLSPKLYNLLMKVYENRWQKNNYYVVADVFNANNAKFLHEESYPNMYYPDEGFRLLALYRYWNMVQYFFPYRNLTDTDWNLVMRECLPSFLDASDTLEYINACKRLIAKCDDTHGSLYSESMMTYLKYFRTPFDVRFLHNDTLVVGSYRNPEKIDNSGPKIGDVITHINHLSVQQLVDSLAPLVAASNHQAKLRKISSIITSGWEDSVCISFVSQGIIKEATIPRFSFYDLNYVDTSDGLCYRVIDDSIGYISMDDLTAEVIKTLSDTLQHTKGLIIDLREYPQKVFGNSLSPIISNQSISFAQCSKPIIENPGAFGRKSSSYTVKGKKYYSGRIVILVDENTQSQSEFCAMSFRTNPKSVVIGNTTAGADGNITNITLPGGIQTYFSGLGVYYPDGTETQRVGIIPDIYVWPTVRGIREGRDEILEKALEILSR